jgi:hypothetical protein
MAECGGLLAERASYAGVFWEHASKDRGAAAAGRVANQERQRTRMTHGTASFLEGQT